MYEKIILDEEYQNMMILIESFHFVDNGKWDWEHGIEHAIRVSNYIKHILTSLHENDKVIELGMIAGLLHDIGLMTGVKKNHAIMSANYAKSYLKKLPLKQSEQDIIIQAIEDHSKGENIKSKVGAALLLADKLDVSHHRVKNSTIHDAINNEFSKINRVDIEIIDDYLYVFYKTKTDFNPFVFKNWKKALTIPYVVADYLQKKCIIRINHQNLDIESVVGI